MGCGCNKNKDTKSSVKVNPKTGFLPEVKTNAPKLPTRQPAVSRAPKQEPSLLRKALNLGEAVANHVADGMTKCTKAQVAARLEICKKCPERHEMVCTKCGCDLSVKAGWRSSTCPMDKWPKIVTE